MKLLTRILFTVAFCAFVSLAWGQSAVYIYKNPKTGQGDYMVVYGMPSKADAEFLAQEKLVELGYAEELIRKQDATSSKGYGIIIQSTFNNRFGRSITVFGASLGCKTKEQSEQLALENIKKFNPEWQEGTSYKTVQRFLDR